MLLNFIKAEFRHNLLLEKYLELVDKGVIPSEILVLVQNSTIKKKITDEIVTKLNLDAFEKLNIHSFFSIVYNSLNENWCFVENSISGVKAGSDNTLHNQNKSFILPNLVGLEVSQFLLKDILRQYDVKGYNSKKSLLHQIFRRYSLIVQNHLSNDDVKERSKILKESFGDDAEFIIKKLLAKTLNTRSLDYLRQTLVFNHIYKNTDYFKNIKYLLVDDADEMTPVCFEFIKYLKPQLSDWLICFDSLGSSRCGYLSADTSIDCKLKRLFNEEIVTYDTEKSFQEENGDIIFSNVIDCTKKGLKNFSLTSLSKRAEIIDFSVVKIQELINSGITPSEIAIITPLQDDMLRFTLSEKLKNCNLMFLSGSEKLVDNSLVKSSLNILKLMLGLEISEMDLRGILYDYVNIPLKYCENVLLEYSRTKELPSEIEFYNENYEKFYKAFCDLKNKDVALSKIVYEMFNRAVSFVDINKINKFNFFIKQLKDFENVLGEKVVKERIADIINQFENSIIAENPTSTLEILQQDLVVATPQKIIDNKISTKYQFWLDVSHSDWVKTDTGPLYNAWVFQADWSKDEYTVEDDIYLSSQKTARILRKLLLLSKEYTYALSSLFDPSGAENLGGIEGFLISDEKANEEKKIEFKIIPRPDQQPVLDYESGSMAISAVPGAGKTTILLALILKLMNKGVNPSNIYVLTYMDSAARNFRERIKNMTPNNTQLPNISTIHGLALKIIKDNSNFERLGLASDFEICDDSQRLRIIKNISGKNLKKDIEDFDRAISVIKLQEGDINSSTIQDKKIEKFKTFYNEYQNHLKEANLIDYDDILLLSVKLLEQNNDILEYYQQICEYIIEDEAQDSSGIQQKLISYLSGKHKNLIRCGDINQAITTTFSNADVEGFRTFIKNSDKLVEMNHSQRCTQDVMDLANKTVLWGKRALPKAFFKSMMKGVEGKNPISENAVISKVFDRAFEEKNYVLREIKNILTKNKDATVGILLRSNYQVVNWTSFVNDAGFKTITRSESLEQKGVFNTIFSILKYLQTPFNNESIINVYETLSELGFYKQRLQLEIRKCASAFIAQSIDAIDSPEVARFLWDMQYWLNSSTLPIEQLVTKIGLYYYTSEIEKSNVYLIATLVKKLNNNDFNLTVERLEALSKRPSLSGFKFFSEENDENAIKGKVQIMTLHKSKGDEFDYVFIPELTEKSLSVDAEKMALKSSTLFMELVRGFNKNYKVKSEAELKDFSAEESMRLFYVAVTRAKKRLYITAALKSKSSFGKDVVNEPNLVFSEILN